MDNELTRMEAQYLAVVEAGDMPLGSSLDIRHDMQAHGYVVMGTRRVELAPEGQAALNSYRDAHPPTSGPWKQYGL